MLHDLTTLAREIHANAAAHGWWDNKPDAATLLALIHSEWSEALEEYRAGRPNAYVLVADGPDDEPIRLETDPAKWGDRKPDGVCVELIDGCIRILDWMGARAIINDGDDGENDLGKNCGRVEINHLSYKAQSLPHIIERLHYNTALASDHLPSLFRLRVVLRTALGWVAAQGCDPLELMRLKHEYNKSRPYRHGGKRC